MKQMMAMIMAAALLIAVLCACGNTTTTAVKEEVEEESATNVISTNKKDVEKEDADEGELEIVESGYTVMAPNSIGDIYLTYAVTIKNNNQKLAADFPVITVTGRSEDGSILFSEEQTLGTILPGDTVSWADDVIDCKGEEPASVDIKVEGADFVKPERSLNEAVESSSFKIENLSEVPGDYDTAVTGEITNNSDTDFESVAVIVILKNQGTVVGGFTGYADNLSAGKQSAFDISSFMSDLPAHDSIEVVAQGWM